MISVSNEYKRQLIAGNRNWKIKVPVFLASNQTSTPDFTLTNSEIWEQGIVTDQATSNDDSFDIGSAIVGSLKVIINNIKGQFSSYDFYNARLVLWLGVEGDVDENDQQVFYRIGFYSVDQPSYNGSLITLNCLDNMTWFDAPFSEVTGITYPITAGQFVADICSHVGVTLGTVTFPNYTTQITIAPTGELNCREALQYVAQICCCYCKINTAGELVLAWYDKNEIIGLTDYDGGTFNTNTTPYSDGCELDGGSFDPWNTGDSADGGTFTDLMSGAYLTQNFQMEVSTDNIVVTGCRVRNTASTEDAYDELWVDSTLEQTHERYVLVIENNPFVDSSNAATIANTVGSILAGLPIRAFSATSLSDFSYETGDMVTISDFRGHIYRTWITHFTFTTNNSEQFNCGAESIRKKSEERFSSVSKTLAEAQENANNMLSVYDQAQAAMNELAQEALGYNIYEYDVTGGGHVTWLYSGTTYDDTDPEHPLFPNSDTVIKISGDGLFISKDHGAHYYEGLDANSGTAILNMIFAHGITADWIKAGTLTLGGDNDVNGVCSVLDSTSTEKVRLDHNGVHVKAGTIEGATIKSENISNNNVLDSVNITGGLLSIKNNANKFLTIRQATTSGVLTGEVFAIGGGNCAGYNNSVYYGDSSTPVHGWSICKAGYQAEAGSDERLKTKIKSIESDYVDNLIYTLRPVEFVYKRDTETLHYGLIAQEVRKSLDDMGEERKLYLEHFDGEYRSVEYYELIAPLIKAVQDLHSEVENLKEQIAELEERSSG